MSGKKKISIASYAMAASVLFVAPLLLSTSRPCGVMERRGESERVQMYLANGGARPRLHCSASWPTVAQLRVAAVPLLRREWYALLVAALGLAVVFYAIAQLLQGLAFLLVAIIPDWREVKHGL